MDIVPGLAIAGRSLYNGDILHSKLDGKIQFRIKGSNIQITMIGLSELLFNCSKQACELKLNYGKIFTDASNNIHLNSAIITNKTGWYLPVIRR